MLRNAIKIALARAGYRLVPRDRDAQTLYETIHAIPFRTIIDVGANVGTTVQKWAVDFPKAHIHAIEPLPAAFKALKALERRYKGRVSTWNFAASDRSGQESFFVHTDHPTSSSLLRSTSFSESALPFTGKQREETVRLEKLDAFFAEADVSLERPILIKLDVQGAEEQVLNGALGLLAHTKVIITEVSIAPVYEAQSTFASVLHLLEKHGYDFQGFIEQFHLEDGRAVYVDAVFTKREM